MVQQRINSRVIINFLYRLTQRRKVRAKRNIICTYISLSVLHSILCQIFSDKMIGSYCRQCKCEQYNPCQQSGYQAGETLLFQVIASLVCLFFSISFSPFSGKKDSVHSFTQQNSPHFRLFNGCFSFFFFVIII